MALTDRDRRVVHALWSAGALDGETIRLAVSPTTGSFVFRRRLIRLVQSGYLSVRRVAAVGGVRYLYALGPRSVRPGVRLWKPSLHQLDHTLAIGHVLARLLQVGFAAPLRVSWWQGESEIRSTASGNQPYPDLRVHWECGARTGCWAVEVDRSTEPHAVWRRKMVRYLGGPEQILAVTLSKRRAAGLVAVGGEVGVDLLATTEDLLCESLDPPVLSARLGVRLPLSEATVGGAAGCPPEPIRPTLGTGGDHAGPGR